MALLTQGLLYFAAAIISTVNVGLFLRLVHPSLLGVLRLAPLHLLAVGRSAL